ncbi:MAG: hypothetical protein Q9160_004016 [Pyrenula sp. 1 TL-2023]
MSSEAGSDSRPQTPLNGTRTPLGLSRSDFPSSPGRTAQRSRGATESAAGPAIPLSRPTLASAQTTQAGPSMLNIFSHPDFNSSLSSTPGSPSASIMLGTKTVEASNRLRAEIIEGITEIVEELDKADEQIADYALAHIHADEIILTHTASLTVQKFLLKAASKRKFTVVLAEGYPNAHRTTHATLTGRNPSSDNVNPTTGPKAFEKTLTSAGITVVLIPDSAIFALMARVNKVILGTHAVLADGSLIAAAGSNLIAQAAKVHKTPVVVLSGTFKLCPNYPFDPETYIEYGDASKVFPYQEADLVEKVAVKNPVLDFVAPRLVDLYITNVGGHAPSYLYKIIKDQYRDEDVDL